jgi:IMP dehydrogenase/GMP reductase
MKKNLRNLVSAIKKYQTQTQLMQESKFELVEQFAKLSERSPIYHEVGCNLDDDETTEALTRIIRRQQPPPSPSPRQPQKSQAAPNNDVVESYPMPKTSIVAQIAEEYQQKMNTIRKNDISDNHDNKKKNVTSLYGLYHFGAAQAVANDYEYQIHIVEYVTEWERIVTGRVDSELKNVRALEKDRRHYERKVDALRQKCNDLQSKNRPCPQAQLDKLQRNEDKLKEAFTIHEREAGKVCALLEAITHEGYMDLYPLVKNYMKWEMNRVGREHDVATQMTTTLDAMTEKCGPKRKEKTRPR